jgi:hypothetical protein
MFARKTWLELLAAQGFEAEQQEVRLPDEHAAIELFRARRRS